MAGHFEGLRGGGAAMALDEVEISILRSLAVQLLELVGPGDEPADAAGDRIADRAADEAADADAAWPPFFSEGPSEPPSDPALARLFPDAYGGGPDTKPDDDDPDARAASAEFRRFTENDLRARKREDALAVVRGLDALTVGGDGGAVLTLTAEDSRRWLGTLNDLRLAVGTRLEVTDDEDGGGLYSLPDSDPRKPMVMAYLWLGGLQETLVETLMP